MNSYSISMNLNVEINGVCKVYFKPIPLQVAVISWQMLQSVDFTWKPRLVS